MLRNLYHRAASAARRHARKAVMLGVAVLSMYSPMQAQERPEYREPAREYAVQEGDNLWDISRRVLREEGKETTPHRIYWKANSLALINGKGTLGQFPWHEGYDCETTEHEDPNCIYTEEIIALEQHTEPLETIADETRPSQQESDSSGYLGLGLLALLAASGLAEVYRRKKDRERKMGYLEDLVDRKNRNPYKSIDDLADGHPAFAHSAVGNYFDMYRKGLVEKKFERYDNRIAPEEMKREMVEKYEKGGKSLEQVSRELGDKYGMNVSRSTISRHARKELGVDSRKEAVETAA